MLKARAVLPALPVAPGLRPASARLGSARLGSARLGSARLGSARLGSADTAVLFAPGGEGVGQLWDATERNSCDTEGLSTARGHLAAHGPMSPRLAQ